MSRRTIFRLFVLAFCFFLRDSDARSQSTAEQPIVCGTFLRSPECDISKEISQLRAPALPTTETDAAISAAIVPTVLRSELLDVTCGKLQQECDFHFDEVPLREALEQLSRGHNLHIEVDHPSLLDEGFDIDKDRITFHAKGMTLGAGLHHLLFLEHRLRYLVSERGLMVTTPTFADSANANDTRIYPIADLTLTHHSNRRLEDLIVSTIESDSWSDVGGSGELSFFHDHLVVSQNPHIQDAVLALIAALRKLPATHSAGLPFREVGAGNSKNNTRVQSALEKRISADFNSAPVNYVADYFRDELDCPLFVDHWALEDEGIRADRLTLSGKLNQVPAETALRSLLAQRKLALVAHREALLITTQTKRNETLTTYVYHVPHLFTESANVVRRGQNLERIKQLLESQVSGEFWDVYGGPGTIGTYPERCALVVSATQPIHAKLGKLLRALPSPPQQRATASLEDHQAHATEYAVVAYPLTETFLGESSTELISLLETLLSGSDNALEVDEKHRFIRKIGNYLIFSHRRELHAPFQSILKKLAAI